MRILLTHGYFILEDEREQRIMKPYPPLGLQYISAFLEKNGWEHEVFDSTFSNLNQLQAYLLEFQPKLIGIYTNLMTKINVVKIIRFIRSQSDLQHTKIVLGGPEVRNHKEKFLRAGADVIAFGEGEATLLELVEHYAKEQPADLSQINGIAYLDNAGVLQTNPERPLLRELDSLPFPNRKKNRSTKILRCLESTTRIQHDYHQYHAGLPIRLSVVQQGRIRKILPPPQSGECGGRNGPTSKYL